MTVVAETFIPRNSSNIAEVSYEPDVENLTITFQSGDVYLYFNVPPHEYRGLCAAGSVGQYFHRNIKSRYSYEQQ
jgi:ABC-type uncharacterized transport system substrate-binding protein